MMSRLRQFWAINKCIIAYIVLKFRYKELYRKNVWLISEKLTEARDNGYHLFVYLRTNYPELPVYYAIDSDSADLIKIEKYGNIIQANSLKHYVYYLCSKISINSQPGGAGPSSKRVLRRIVRLRRKDQHIVFLQHGIIKDELPHSFDYEKTKYSLFVCSAKRERDFIIQTYGYPRDVALNLGLCRFDNLFKNKKKSKRQILVMPTFRGWLISKELTKEATAEEKKKFIKSEYYITYKQLLTNTQLLELLKDNGYTLVFYPHYAMQPFIKCFYELTSDEVVIADRWNYDVQQLLIESAVMITDFSSVFFDFAYMEKPEIFFQFDDKRYRAEHYQEGYFDYRRDAFGPVFEKCESVVDYLSFLLNNGCEMENIYLERVQAFFTYQDDNNCERNYKAIKRLA